MRLLTFILLIFVIIPCSSQENENELSLQDTINNYFQLPREDVFLHLNKNLYHTNETIWFQAYVLDRVNKLLNTETTNLYISLLNETKKEIKSSLFLVNNGTVNGNIELNDSIKSGTYFLHCYTNYMNNFEEDESSFFKVEIINIKNSTRKNNSNLFENANLEAFVEGGNFLYNCDNTVGVYFKNCLGEGIKHEDIKVYNEKNEVITSFSTNSEGFGAFQIFNLKNEIFTIVAENETSRIEKKLPFVSIEGITMNVINYVNDDKLIIHVKTNSLTLNKLKNNKFKILSQQNNKINSGDLELDQLTKSIVIKKNNLFTGINCIRLLDSKNNLISERLIYNHKNKQNRIKLEKISFSNDSIVYRGKLDENFAILSISVLPSETKSNFNNNSIIAHYNINSSITNPINNYNYYFNDFNKQKEYELDLLMLTQSKVKYSWNSILNKKPIEKHSFEKGLTFEVTLNQNQYEDVEIFDGFLIGTNVPIFAKEKMKDKAFTFKNIVATDSTELIFSAQKKGKTIQAKGLYKNYK